MSWWLVVPDALTLGLLIVVPGALALGMLGLRGLPGLAAAPPVTIAALGVLSVVFAPLGLPWRLPSVLVGLLVGLVVLGVLTRANGLLWGRRMAGRSRGRHATAHGLSESAAPSAARLGVPSALAVAVGVLLGIGLLTVPMVSVLPGADAPLQQWDAVFHLNAVVVARETGVVTPLGGLSPLYGDGNLAPYYPTGWHAAVALTPTASVPAATNVAVIVLCVGAWVLGLAGLAREVFADRLAPAVLAPLLAAGFVALTVQVTALAQLPNALSTALLPGALLLAVRAVRAGLGAARACAIVAAAAGLGGVVIAHGSGMFAYAVLAGPLVVGAVGAWGIRLWRSGSRGAAVGIYVTTAAVVVVGPVVLANLDALSSVVGFERAGRRSYPVAVRQLLLDQTLSRGFPGDGWQHIAVTAATLAGAALTLVRRRHRWVTVSYVIAVGLAVLAQGPEGHPLRWLAGFWYTQAGRIAPVAVVPAVILAAYALSSPVVALYRRRGGAMGVAAVVLLVIVVGTAVVRLPLQARVVESVYVPERLAWGTLATTGELAMMHRLAEELPPDAVVVGDTFNGSALLPAVAGIDVVFPQLGTSGMTPTQRLLEERLARLHEDPAVCEALRQVGATHLYQDSARREQGAKVNERTAGMWDVDVSAGFDEVDSADTATVYRIEVCG